MLLEPYHAHQRRAAVRRMCRTDDTQTMLPCTESHCCHHSTTHSNLSSVTTSSAHISFHAVDIIHLPIGHLSVASPLTLSIYIYLILCAVAQNQTNGPHLKVYSLYKSTLQLHSSHPLPTTPPLPTLHYPPHTHLHITSSTHDNLMRGRAKT